MKTLKVGVIGLGMGRGHIRGYQSHSGAEVVAIADLDTERLEKVGDEFGIKERYEDPLKMLADEQKLTGGSGYIYLKQLEEAEYLVVNKNFTTADLIINNQNGWDRLKC